MNFSIVQFEERYHDELVDLWYRAVTATHHFLDKDDLAFYHGMVKDGALRGVELWICMNEAQRPIGFIGLSGAEIEMLFVDPRHHGAGAGTTLVRHAERLKGPRLQVDVNEQNEGARAFYEKYGFVIDGRSELDGSGKPYPLLHMAIGR